MKKKLTLLTLLFSVFVIAQKTMRITQNKHIPKNGFYVRLNTVFDDSRCPEGVTCIWAGEVSATLEVYNDKKLIEEKNMTFNASNRVENIKWFENYISKKIKGIGIAPYPKQGRIIKPKEQYINIVFVD
jgi:hypothetical protein